MTVENDCYSDEVPIIVVVRNDDIFNEFEEIPIIVVVKNYEDDNEAEIPTIVVN